MFRTISLLCTALIVSSVALPQNLAVRGSVSLSARQDVAVVGNYAFAVGSNSLAGVNFSSPQSPSVFGQVAPGVGTLSAVAVRGDYAYCAGQGSGVVVVDISTPAAPDWVRNVQAAAPIVDVAIGDTFLAAATGLNVTLYGLSNAELPHLLTTYGRAANRVIVESAARKIHCAGPTGAFELTWTVSQGNVTISETDDYGSAEYTSVGLGGDYVNYVQNLQLSALTRNTYSLAGQYGAAAQIRTVFSGADFSLIGMASGGVEYLRQTANTPQLVSSAQAPGAINGLALSANEQYVLAATQSGVTVFESSPLSSEPQPPLPQKLALSAYPNPFNSRATIQWQAPLRQAGELRVFDLLGRSVITQPIAAQATGIALDFHGQSAGSYWIELVSGDNSEAVLHVLYLP